MQRLSIKLLCYFTGHEHSRQIAIGKPTVSNVSGFPPLRTVYAAFTAHGAPSNLEIIRFKHNLHTSLQH